jgi:hypothetical protein
MKSLTMSLTEEDFWSSRIKIRKSHPINMSVAPILTSGFNGAWSRNSNIYREMDIAIQIRKKGAYRLSVC